MFNHASTMGLNAVITRALPKVAFLTTEGHRDILDRGRIWRPPARQSDTSWRRPFGDAARPLVPRYLRRGITERLLADGSVHLPLDEDQARGQLEVLKRCAVEGVAICLLNAYVDPVHERRLRELVHEVLGEASRSRSPPRPRRWRRSTRARRRPSIDVFMKLIFTGYAHGLDERLRDAGFAGELNFADCAATLLPWDEALEQPFRIVFAGPAAGTMSSQRLGEALGERNLVCCDVGGTSTDVSLVVDGAPFVDNTFELEHDLIINALSTEISSVGAGGGSIVSISASGDVVVGPCECGLRPGAGVLRPRRHAADRDRRGAADGHSRPRRLRGRRAAARPGAPREAFASLETPLPLEQRIGFAFRIAAANIAEEVTNVVLRRGGDPRDFTLVAYGAAGPMLLPAALELMHVRRVVVPPHPGNFSALGPAQHRPRLLRQPQRVRPAVPGVGGADRGRVRGDGAPAARARRQGRRGPPQLRRAALRPELGDPVRAGPDGPIDIADLVERFHETYERRYGNSFPYIPVQGVSYRVELRVPSEKVEFAPPESR